MGVSVLSTDSQNSGHKTSQFAATFLLQRLSVQKGKIFANSDKDILWISPIWSTTENQALADLLQVLFLLKVTFLKENSSSVSF